MGHGTLPWHVQKGKRTGKVSKDGILVNGLRCRVTQVLKPGDCLEISGENPARISRREERKPSSLVLLLTRSAMRMRMCWCVNKPAGILMHPVGCHQGDTLADQERESLRRKGEQETPRCIGRLDKETSGAVVFAKNQMAAARLQRQRQEGVFRKEYLALAEGSFQEKRQTVTLPIANAAGKARESV